MNESTEDLQRLSEDQANELASRTARELTEHPTPEAYQHALHLLTRLPHRLTDEDFYPLWVAVMSAPEEIAEPRGVIGDGIVPVV